MFLFKQNFSSSLKKKKAELKEAQISFMSLDSYLVLKKHMVRTLVTSIGKSWITKMVKQLALYAICSSVSQLQNCPCPVNFQWRKLLKVYAPQMHIHYN